MWDVDDWQRAWDLAMSRIQGVPAIVVGQVAFHHAVDMLDRGFADGDRFQFELGLLTLMDCCSEAINRGDCGQWWWNGQDGDRKSDAKRPEG